MKYWLFKTEPETFSWEDLKKSKNKTTAWEGVRNYQARNFFKEMQIGDLLFFYHSVVKPLCIMGIAKVVKEAYPDHHQFDPSSKYFDISASMDNPRWFMVDVQWVQDFIPPVERELLMSIPQLQNMHLLQRGSRLSIQPVAENEWNTILSLQNKSNS
ncbi:MAG: EVE domain-containing protein [Spirochaetia bacterium]|nr:EVE domain-containing protein [Spirochaetia bacterium]